MTKHFPLGVDVGGTGIKGAPVNLATGEFADERLRFDTPEGASPKDVCDEVAKIVEHFADQIGDEPIGVTIPGVVQHGVVKTAANIDKEWLELDAEKLISERIGRPVLVVNDADAAGVAENFYGAAKDRDGLILMTTLGTGIGTAIINNGVLVPNSELGHLEVKGKDAETRAANSVRERDELSWEKWAKRLTKYYTTLENLLWPDLIVVGGGVSKKAEHFLPLIDIRTEIIPAKLLNTAGIAGAARLAHEVFKK